MRPTEGEFCWARNSTHSRGRFGHIASIVFAALAIVCLAGCGGGPSTSSFFSSATSLFSSSTKIALAPIVGAPQPVADQFTQALVVAGKDRHLTILPGGGSAAYTLRGYLLASSEKGGSKISYIFDVTDAKGTRVARVSGDELVPGKAADPWDAVNGTVLNTIAGKTTSQLAASSAAWQRDAGRRRLGGNPCRHGLGATGSSRLAAGKRRARGPRSGRSRRRAEIPHHGA